MKKRILSLAAASCLLLILAACGGGDAPQEESPSGAPASEAPVQESAPAQDSSGLPTLEDYFNSDAMQELVDATAAQYGEEGTSAAMYAEGNELRYDFTIDSLETSEEERAVYAEALQSSTEAGADAYRSTAAELKSMVSNEEVVVVVTFLDGAGNVLYSQSFSSNDAE